MFKMIRAFMFRNDSSRCKFCGKKLTEHEKLFYCCACEKCEKKLLENLSNKY